jgi:uncharacterized membrane protein
MRERGSRPGLGPAALAVALALAMAGATNAASTSITASVDVLPLEIILDLSDSDALVGESIRARATVTNAGSTRVTDVIVEIRVDSSRVGIRGSPTTTISRLKPGQAASVSWTLCGSQAGNYFVLARATLDGASVESEARLLTISGQRRRGC